METMIDNKDFEQTTVPHMDFLHNYALYLTKNIENANDLVQDTLLKAFRFWDNYERGTNIKAWLIKIMKNSHINFYRKKVREPRAVEFDEKLFHYDSNQFEPFDPKTLKSDTSYEEIFEDEVARSIKSLSHDFRTIVLLCDIENFSYEEIANIINCPIGTVRSRLYRGRKQLQNELFNYAKENRYILKGCQD